MRKSIQFRITDGAPIQIEATINGKKRQVAMAISILQLVDTGLTVPNGEPALEGNVQVSVAVLPLEESSKDMAS